MQSQVRDVLPMHLASMDVQVLKEFVHRCMDDLCGRKGPSQDMFAPSTHWTSGQFSEAVARVKDFVVETVTHSYDKKKLSEILPVFDETQINGVMGCISVRKDEIQDVILSRALQTPGTSLQDFDWKVKWVMGSSSLSSLEEPLLQLDLSTVKRVLSTPLSLSNTSQDNVSVELNQENLNALISALEAVDESLSK